MEELKDIPINFYVTKELFDRLHKVSKKTGIPKAELVRRGLRRILPEYERLPGGTDERQN